MPLSADLVAACGTHPTTADILVAQLERIGLLDIITLLSFRASFMAPASLADADITVLQTALRGDAPTDASFPNGAPGVVALRVVLHAARLRWRAIEAATAAAAAPGPGPAPAPAPADDHDLFKALPPSDIRAIWEGGEIATRGLSWVPDRFRLADSLVSRMHRANKSGDFWLPALDKTFAYMEERATASIKTLFAAGTAKLQVTVGDATAERVDPLRLVADYNAAVRHRTSAAVAVYCTDAASVEFKASPRFSGSLLTSHSLVASELRTRGTPELIVLPQMLAKLEHHLCLASREGYSMPDMLDIDSRIIQAVIDRGRSNRVDGNLAIEYVCDSCADGFRPRVHSVPLAMVGSQQFDSGDGSSISPSQSASNLQPSKRERELQSDRDRLANQLQRRNDVRGGSSTTSNSVGKLKPQKATVNRTVYGGRSGSLGGGDDRGREICDLFNGDAGCYRGSCAYKHCCNVARCREPWKHSALNH